MTSEDDRGEGWRAFAREEAGTRPVEPVAEPAAGASEMNENEPEPTPKPAGAKGRGAERVSIRSVGRRVRVIADASVSSASVTGPHVLRRSGTVLEIVSEGQAGPLEGFNLLKLPRSLDDLKNLGLGAELVVAVNPKLIVDAEVTGSGLSIEGIPTLGRVRVSAGSASIKGVRQAEDALFQMATSSVEGTFAGGRSRVKCESGGLTVVLSEDANVTVRGTANMGRLAWPGGGAVDEWVAGNGSGRLDVEIVMGMAFIKDAASSDGSEAGADSGTQPSAPGASGCRHEGETGRFCSQCGSSLAATCGSCGAARPAGAKFCPECGTAVETAAN